MIPFVQQLKKDKLNNYIVSTNDSNFDDVKTIIGDDFENGKPYLITNTPILDGTYIQNGRRHTVLGMEYNNQAVGYQMSYGTQKTIYRIKNQGAWQKWQDITINYYLPVNQDFNSVIQPGVYWFNNGSSPTGDNKPTGETGFLEVVSNSSGNLTTQIYTTYNGKGVYQRGCYNNNWSDWVSLISNVNVIDNLTSTSATDALSANQGRILYNKFNQRFYGTRNTYYLIGKMKANASTAEIVGHLSLFFSNLDYYDKGIAGFSNVTGQGVAGLASIVPWTFSSYKKIIYVYSDNTYLYVFVYSPNYNDNWYTEVLTSRNFTFMWQGYSSSDFNSFIANMTLVSQA